MKTYQYILYYNPHFKKVDMTWYDETLIDHIAKYNRFSAYAKGGKGGMMVIKPQNTYIHTAPNLSWKEQAEFAAAITSILPAKNKHCFLGTIKDLRAEYPEVFL